MYILNERKYIEKILKDKKKPDDLPKSYLITLITKYYYDEKQSVSDLEQIVKENMREFNFNSFEYQEYKWANKIHNICLNLNKEDADISFAEREFIPIYSCDLDVINKCESDREKKFMFTLYALARYMNCDGWVNKKDLRGWTEIFKLANIAINNDKKCVMIHELYKNGFISMSKKVDNLNIKVDIEETGNVIYKITEFKNLGNQYIGNFKNGYRQCIFCGKKIRIKSIKDFSSKYCNECATMIQFNQKKDWDRNSRNR